jgi:hypothetical protein
MSTIDLQQQSIQGDVSEETKTVKIPGRIGGYLHHASVCCARLVEDAASVGGVTLLATSPAGLCD